MANFINRAVSAFTKRIIAPLKSSLEEGVLLYQELIFPEKNPTVLSAIHKLKEQIKSLPPLPLDGISPAENKWLRYRNQLRKQILQRDPNRFLTWTSIRSTMFLENIYQDEVEYLKKLHDFNSWVTALKESPIGSPSANHKYFKSSPNLIHHAFSVAKLIQAHNVPLSSLGSVVEIGGGYGSMCRLFYNKGYKGKYFIYDLPEFSALQNFYLSLVLSSKNYSRTSLIVEKVKLDSIQNIDIFIATWSISEMSVVTRDSLLNAAKNPKYYLIAYQAKFADVDNMVYFSELMKKYVEYDWIHEEMPHLPGNYYLFGKRK